MTSLVKLKVFVDIVAISVIDNLHLTYKSHTEVAPFSLFAGTAHIYTAIHLHSSSFECFGMSKMCTMRRNRG